MKVIFAFFTFQKQAIVSHSNIFLNQPIFPIPEILRLQINPTEIVLWWSWHPFSFSFIIYCVFKVTHEKIMHMFRTLWIPAAQILWNKARIIFGVALAELYEFHYSLPDFFNCKLPISEMHSEKSLKFPTQMLFGMFCNEWTTSINTMCSFIFGTPRWNIFQKCKLYYFPFWYLILLLTYLK